MHSHNTTLGVHRLKRRLCELEIIMDFPLKSDYGCFLISPSNLSDFEPVVVIRDWILSKIRTYQSKSE